MGSLIQASPVMCDGTHLCKVVLGRPKRAPEKFETKPNSKNDQNKRVGHGAVVQWAPCLIRVTRQNCVLLCLSKTPTCLIWCTRQDTQRACRSGLRHLYSSYVSSVPPNIALDNILIEDVNQTCSVYHRLWHQIGYSKRSTTVHSTLHSLIVSSVNFEHQYNIAQFKKLGVWKARAMSSVGIRCSSDMSGALNYFDLDFNDQFLYLGLFIPRLRQIRSLAHFNC